MTYNKSQGQTMNNVLLDITSPPFAQTGNLLYIFDNLRTHARTHPFPPLILMVGCTPAVCVCGEVSMFLYV
jgi:hypothetical protein